MNKSVVIIGGGLSGLAAAYQLIDSGCEVTLLESAPTFGGLASSLKVEGQPVERFYHFICRTDVELVRLADELGLQDKLHWFPTKTGFYFDGQMYPFGTPLDLLGFSPIPWLQRLRFGIHIVASRLITQWKHLDRIPAKAWLIKNIGEQAYNAIWHPLLKIKFGDRYEQVSAAWIWHRIWRVARSRRSLLEPEMFGYFEQGSAVLYEGLVKKLQLSGIKLKKNVRVNQILVTNNHVTGVETSEGLIPCQAVISTVPLPILNQFLPGHDGPYFKNIRSIEYIGVVCMLLSLDRPLGKNFWTNINDPQISFNGFIELTNLNQHLNQQGLNLVYVPYYLSTSEPRYHYSDEQLLDEYVLALKKVNPQFSAKWIKEWHVFRDPYAQAICTTHFSEKVPPVQTPIAGLFVTDSTQYYPEDRTLSAAIRLGRSAAKTLLEDPEWQTH